MAFCPVDATEADDGAATLAALDRDVTPSVEEAPWASAVCPDAEGAEETPAATDAFMEGKVLLAMTLRPNCADPLDSAFPVSPVDCSFVLFSTGAAVLPIETVPAPAPLPLPLGCSPSATTEAVSSFRYIA